MQLSVDLPPNIQKADRGSWKTVADITADAFSEDPVNTWIFGRFEAIRSCFRVLSHDVYSRRGMCHIIPGSGATMWAHSDDIGATSALTLMKLATGVLRYGASGSVQRAIKAGEILEQHHPKERHMYLFTIGVAKAARGQGLGHALIAPVLDACDREGLPVYLENSNPANFGFYSAHGFEHVKHFAAGDGGPPLQAMWREPR